MIARWYVWSVLKGRDLKAVLSPLLRYVCLPANGLMLVIAVPVACGDPTAAVLALIALAFIRFESPFAVPAVWLFNIVGFLDLRYANVWLSVS
jgi:hypothetical protein